MPSLRYYVLLASSPGLKSEATLCRPYGTEINTYHPFLSTNESVCNLNQIKKAPIQNPVGMAECSHAALARGCGLHQDEVPAG